MKPTMELRYENNLAQAAPKTSWGTSALKLEMLASLVLNRERLCRTPPLMPCPSSKKRPTLHSCTYGHTHMGVRPSVVPMHGATLIIWGG